MVYWRKTLGRCEGLDHFRWNHSFVSCTEMSRRGVYLNILANGLLESTEGLAQEEIRIEETVRVGQEHRPFHVRLFIFPMIVTNAKLAVCRFDPKNVSLEQGVLDPDKAEIFEVPMIRFRKSL